MKNSILKKFSFMMVFVFALVLSSVPVFAATPEIHKDAPSKGSIKISKSGARFTAYKLLDATKDGEAYEYKINSNFKDFFTKEKKYTVESIKDLKGEELKDFAVELHKYVRDKKIAGDELKNKETNPVDLGYYLILETSSSSKGAAVASAPITVSVPYVENNSWKYDADIKVKDNEPTLEKNIIGENGDRQKTSTANIGDTVNYEVKASIPMYPKDAKNIMYKFTDTMSKGLKYDEKTGVKVASAGRELTLGKEYSVDCKKQENGETKITINFKYDDIKDYVVDGVTLNYKATLDKDAVITNNECLGNTNNVELEYTNNPYIKGSYKKLTDTVNTYTFGLAITKVDSEAHDKHLEGAKFSVKDLNGKAVAMCTYNEEGQIVPLEGNGVTNSNGVATFLGLKEGTYTIKEEAAPSGYRLLKDPVQVTIKADRDEKTNKCIGTATINISNGNKAGEIKDNLTANDGNKLLNVQIENTPGFSLPSTGGLGNTGFIKIAITLLSVVCVLSMLGLGYAKFGSIKNAKH